MDNNALLTPAQVAERFQVETQTVLSWLRTGKLRGAKIGRFWRIREEAIDEMLTAGEEEAARERGGNGE